MLGTTTDVRQATAIATQADCRPNFPLHFAHKHTSYPTPKTCYLLCTTTDVRQATATATQADRPLFSQSKTASGNYLENYLVCLMRTWKDTIAKPTVQKGERKVFSSEEEVHWA